MTPAELTAAREALGLSAAELGRALQLAGRDPGRTVRFWETGQGRVTGPAAVAIGYMLAEQARGGLQEAAGRAKARHAAQTEHAVAQALQQDRQQRAAEDMPPVPRAITELMTIKTRRRGA